MAKKLRFAPEHHVLVLNAPDGYVMQLRPGPADIKTELDPNESFDAVLLFVKDVDELVRLGPSAIHSANPDILLWINYLMVGKTKGVTVFHVTPWRVLPD